jgi:hypothetical protein
MSSAFVLLVLPLWFFALLSGAMGALAVSQAITGLPTHPLMTPRTYWSVGELKVRGLGWTIHWLALATYVLVGTLWLVTFHTIPFGRPGWIPITTLAWLLIISFGPLFQILMHQRHEQRWPFKRPVRT